MIEILKAIFLGIIQGITEWLPISSTGHMILANEFIKMNMSQSFMDMFMVVIQFGSILAVVVLFFYKLNPFALSKSTAEKKSTMTLWFKVLIAVVPAGIIGILFEDKIDALFYNPITVATTLILYGAAFIWLESRKQSKHAIRDFDHLSYQMALLIGVFQVLALIPGTSRSGATILGPCLSVPPRYVAAEFSFFLAIPVMLGASALKLVKFGFGYSPLEFGVLVAGMVTAFVVSLFAIRLLMNFIKKHNFKPFGYYRIILGVLVLVYFGIKAWIG